jgi:hypothetical protein
LLLVRGEDKSRPMIEAERFDAKPAADALRQYQLFRLGILRMGAWSYAQHKAFVHAVLRLVDDGRFQWPGRDRYLAAAAD